MPHTTLTYRAPLSRMPVLVNITHCAYVQLFICMTVVYITLFTRTWNMPHVNIPLRGCLISITPLSIKDGTTISWSLQVRILKPPTFSCFCWGKLPQVILFPCIGHCRKNLLFHTGHWNTWMWTVRCSKSRSVLLLLSALANKGTPLFDAYAP